MPMTALPSLSESGPSLWATPTLTVTMLLVTMLLETQARSAVQRAGAAEGRGRLASRRAVPASGRDICTAVEAVLPDRTDELATGGCVACARKSLSLRTWEMEGKLCVSERMLIAWDEFKWRQSNAHGT